MTVYGNECGSAGFLLLRDGNVLVGDYASPVEVIETYLGEPYVVYIDAGMLSGHQGWGVQIRSGSGGLVVSEVPRKTKHSVTFIPPTTEAGTWNMVIPALEFYLSSTGQWYPYGGGTIDIGKISRYSYAINPV